MKINIQYFAILREQRGLSQEIYETSAKTPLELYEELKKRHRFTLPVDLIKAAVNNEMVELNHSLKESQTVIFIPPVAGG